MKWHTQEQLSVSNSLPSMADIADPPTSPLGATDSTDDSDEEEDEDSEMDDWEPREPQSFNPHSLCEWRSRSVESSSDLIDLGTLDKHYKKQRCCCSLADVPDLILD